MNQHTLNHAQNGLTLKITPRRPALLAGFDNTIDLLVRISGPDTPPVARKRTALNLALVLDRSSSMRGRPLTEAVRCARHVVERLHPDDRLALVIYDNRVQTLVPSTQIGVQDETHGNALHSPVNGKTRFFNALDSIKVGGNTDLHGGWLEGAQQIAPHTKGDVVSRVLLLSDGNANAGLTDDAAITAQCAELAAAGVTTSTYGLGHQFNENLMTAMATSGQGNAYYGETAEDLLEPFQREFDLLDNLFAKKLRLTVKYKEGLQGNVLNPYSQEGEAYILPDLPYGGETWAVIRIKVPQARSGQGDAGNLALIEVSLAAQNTEGHDLHLKTTAFSLPSLPAQAFGAVSEDELVARRVGEIEAANLQTEARKAAQKQDWKSVEVLLSNARERAKDNPWVHDIVGNLETIAQQKDSARFSKEVCYSAMNLSTRVSGKLEEMELCGSSAGSITEDVPSYLRRKVQQGKSEPIA